ncbi:MAG: carbohydrate kinase family protein, partial [Bryobacteraceae bacterium]
FEPLLLKAAQEKRFLDVRHVHLACAPNFDTAGALFYALRANGCSLSLDVGWHEKWLKGAHAFEMLKNADIFFPNEIEARHLTGEEHPVKILRAFSSAGMNRVALKLGSRGAALLWDGKHFFVEARPVAALDTTGAGDCFNAGFLHAFLHGQDPDLCLRTANICAALSTEAFGGITAFPTAERLKRELTKETYA